MIDLHNIIISRYQNVRDTRGRATDLYTFLYGGDRRAVERLRAATDPAERRALKLDMPQATISGLFSSRRLDGLERPSNLLCIDLDAKDNLHLGPAFTSYALSVLSNFEQVLYAARSVGGRGVFAIMPVESYRHHLEHFRYVQKRLRHMSLIVDPACTDITRLRTQSYDPDAYVNVHAVPLRGRLSETGVVNGAPGFHPRRTGVKCPAATPAGVEPRRSVYTEPRRSVYTAYDTDLSRVESKVRALEERRIDITSTYDAWMHTGAALANLGEAGRELFHRLSRLNPGYREADTDRKFTNLLNTTRRIGLGTFFKLASDAL